ncbi:Uncharacterized protein OS=Cystobacter violaceus Cb vi76 GN=Q664_20160 PE=4 SV=1 [Gemmata massiliana]|uniref:Uncharacterized protein n=1 Tax=Gemmata massiliana TaxID=1210884 RepID=A0A6P2DBN6_9BACT|nr:hypothetical protein [Gemmata massiliana]VTR97775.1 Uncharacterized protein OS=Cystobacter violaceus Cb vi76 GN=Q664_20160 PE=4 SV=1 [Gemmata massiliana]
MLPPTADRPKLRATLDQLSAAVEDLLLGGLTTASDATRQTLSGAMQEAARLRLLRLGGTLRVATEELGRFTRQEKIFSRRRLTFFLNRAWLLSRGMGHALDTSDEKEYDRLTWSPPAQPLPAVEVVCLGAVKKVAEHAFVAFEFRLRAVADAGAVKAGQKLSWSAVFPLKKGQDIPPEGFLHLPQKQKFAPFLFLERTTLNIANATVSGDETSGWRLALTDQSTVTVGKPFTGWDQFLAWSPQSAIDRLAKHVPGPLDLDTELQEEIVLRDYEIGKAEDGDEPGQTVYPITMGALTLHALIGAGTEGKALKKSIDEIRKVRGANPPLFGLMHYERCRLVFQPLATFPGSPDYITISKENVNKAALLKAMDFRS